MTDWGAIVLAGGSSTRLGGGLKPLAQVHGVRMLDRVLAAVAGARTIVVVGPSPLDVPAGVIRTQESPPGGGPVCAIAAALSSLDAVALSSLDVVGLCGLEAARLSSRDAAASSSRDAAASSSRDAAVLGGPDRSALDAVAIVAGDLPMIDDRAVETLRAALRDPNDGEINPDGAIHPGETTRMDGAIYVDRDDRPQWLCGIWKTDAIVRRVGEMTSERGTLDGASLRALFGPLDYVRVRHDGDSPPPYFDCDTEGDIRQAEEWLAR